MELNNKKIINAWSMYDWANSAYFLVILVAIFPLYYDDVTLKAFGGEQLVFLGIEITNSVLYERALAFSYLLLALLSPLLSGIADYGGRKKRFMQIFTYLGVFSCIGLALFDGYNITFGMLCVVLASIGASGSLVFYNAYLPEIVTPDKLDNVSARGYMLGYTGSTFLLIVCSLVITNPGWIGLSDSEQTIQMLIKSSFVVVGVWWFGFSQLTFYRLPANVYHHQATGPLFKKGYQEIVKVLKNLKTLPDLKKYLWAFFFYNTGVQTIILLATYFGKRELGVSGDELFLTIILIQLVAGGGAYLFAYVSKWKGNKFSLLLMVCVWVLICFLAYAITDKHQFFALAFVVGTVMGGIQSLSRSTYSKLLPADTQSHASYFSFYDVMEKLSIVFGTFSFSFAEQLTGNMRYSALLLGFFFVIGFVLLTGVKSASLKHR